MSFCDQTGFLPGFSLKGMPLTNQKVIKYRNFASPMNSRGTFCNETVQ
jgi:hypothetical protein